MMVSLLAVEEILIPFRFGPRSSGDPNGNGIKIQTLQL